MIKYYAFQIIQTTSNRVSPGQPIRICHGYIYDYLNLTTFPPITSDFKLEHNWPRCYEWRLSVRPQITNLATPPPYWNQMFSRLCNKQQATWEHVIMCRKSTCSLKTALWRIQDQHPLFVVLKRKCNDMLKRSEKQRWMKNAEPPRRIWQLYAEEQSHSLQDSFWRELFVHKYF